MQHEAATNIITDIGNSLSGWSNWEVLGAGIGVIAAVIGLSVVHAYVDYKVRPDRKKTWDELAWEFQRSGERLFVERLPNVFTNVVVGEPSDAASLNSEDSIPPFESLDDAIIAVKQQAFTTAYCVLPEDVFFIFWKTGNDVGQILEALIASLPCRYSPAGINRYVADYGKAEKGKGYQQNRAIILCEVADAVDLNPLLGNGKHETGNEPQWVQVPWHRI